MPRDEHAHSEHSILVGTGHHRVLSTEIVLTKAVP